MRIRYFFTLFVVFLTSKVFALDWVEKCGVTSFQLQSEETQCKVGHKELNPIRQELLSTLGPKLDDWNLIEIASDNLKKRLQSEIDAEKNYLRWLRGDKGIESHQRQFEKGIQDFEQLKDIVQKLRSLEGCETSVCENDKALLNDLKVSVLSKNSFLADPEVEKCLLQEIEKTVVEDCRKDSFFSSVFNFVNFRIDLRDEISKQLRREDRFLRKGEDVYTLYSKYYTLGGSDNYYAYVLPEIFKVADEDPEKWSNTVCRILDKKEFRDNVHFAGEVALEAGLIVAPFFFPPLGVLRVARLGYLSRYGLTAERVSGAALAAPGVLYVSHRDVLLQEKRCLGHQESYRSNPSVNSYKNYQSCLEEISNKKMMAASGMVLAVTPIPFAGKAEQVFSKGFQVIKSSVDDVMTVVRPSVKEAVPVADAYYRYVAGVYGKRLKLSAEEIEGFMESSRQMADRTTLILKTKANLAMAPPEFKGGIGLVNSRSRDELLPLEKATGFRVPREVDGNAVEIVRLAVTDTQNPNLTKELVGEALSTLSKDPSITKAYVYTSRLHERLYRKLGIPYKVIEKPNSRDVIMEFEVH